MESAADYFESFDQDLEACASFAESVFYENIKKAVESVDKCNNEEATSFTVTVSRIEALEGKDAVKFLEADSLEKVQLDAGETWRTPTDLERKNAHEVIPTATVYT